MMHHATPPLQPPPSQELTTVNSLDRFLAELRELRTAQLRELVPNELREVVADGMATVREASEFLAIGKSLLYEMMAKGELLYAKIHGRRCIPWRALRELAASKLVACKPGRTT